ncbi:MAG: hypothetical protein Kow0068_25800 [Marinilabiliales bacterium]
MKFRLHKYKTNLILIIVLILFSCKKDEQVVPYQHVDFYIFLSDPQFIELNNYYTPVMVTGGVQGIIIYRKSETEFIALERTCTYQPSNRCAVSPDSTGYFVECPCCHSFFSLPSDGYVDKGPAEKPLVQYATEFDGQKIHVYN